MMNAVVLNKHQLTMKQVPIPKPQCGELQLKMLYSGVCRTDLQIAKDACPEELKKDLILGHEGVGTVTELGAGVTGFKVGDVVVAPWHGGSCGKCELCQCGDECYCKVAAATGYTKDGTYAEYTVLQAHAAVLVPDGLEPVQAAPLACAGLTAYKALKESGLKPNQWVAVIGAAGGLGHLAMQYAKAMDLKTVGVDLGADKVKFLNKLGFENCIDGAKDTWLKDLQNITGEDGPHGVLVTAPSEGAYQQALQCVRRRGAVVALSLPPGPILFPIKDVVIKGVRLLGSMVGTQAELQETLEFAVEHKVKCVLKEASLADAKEVFSDLEKNNYPGRAVLSCCKEAKGACLGAQKLAG